MQKRVATGNESSGTHQTSHAREDTTHLPDRFRQQSLEAFTQYTELLRHFYSIVSRAGSQAPAPGTPAAEKIEKILKRLDDIKDRLLNLKNDVSAGTYCPSPTFPDGRPNPDFSRSMNAQVRCISEIVLLQDRACTVWKQYCAS